MDKFDWKLIISSNILKLKVLGLWPKDESFKPNLYTLWTIISLTVFMCGHNFFQIVNIIVNLNDLETITATSFISLSTLVALMKAFYVIRNMEILKKLMVTLNCDSFQPKNVRQISLFEPSLKFWKIVSSLCWTVSCGSVFFWSTYPIFDKSVKEHRLPFLAWYPYNTKISPYYEITYVYQVFCIIFLATTAVSVDNLIAALNVYIGAQFDILSDDVLHLYDVTTIIVEIFMYCWFGNEVELK
ncbi:7tm 6 domain containing protein, partial [Asbolus verrucosus]